MQYLEEVPLGTTTSHAEEDAAPLRFPVQLVLRPDLNFRGFSGQVARGVLRAGERVMALPSRRESVVKRIVTYDGDLAAASYPQSVTVELEDEIDLSRGEMLVQAGSRSNVLPARIGNRFRSHGRLDARRPTRSRTHLRREAHHAQQSARPSRTSASRSTLAPSITFQSESLAMNEVAEVEFETSLPLFFDSYADCRWTGSLILIDAVTNATVGAAMILDVVVAETLAPASAITTRPTLCLLPGRPLDAERLLATFVAGGEHAILIDDPDIPDSAVPAVVRALQLAGVIAVTSRLLDPEIEAAALVVAGSGVMRLDESANSSIESSN